MHRDGEQSRPKIGLALCLIGAVAFAVSCFLPCIRGATVDGDSSPSLYRLFAGGAPESARDLPYVLAAWLLLFAGVAIIAALSIIAMGGRSRTWARPATVATTAVWVASLAAHLLGLPEPGIHLTFGYWAVVGSVVVVAIGAIVLAVGRRAPVVNAAPLEDAAASPVPPGV